MNEDQFLTVLYASVAEPELTNKTLVPYRPPTGEELAKLPRIPARSDYTFRHMLAIKIGRGYKNDPTNFQVTPNPTGVDVMVGIEWRFRNGVFENAQGIVWPGAPRGNDVLIYDPNWPWMQLVMPKPSAEVRRLLKPGYLLSDQAGSDPPLDELLRNAHDREGKFVWAPGEFWIEMKTLAEDIQDVRSPAQKIKEETFERQRKGHQRYRAERVAWRPMAFEASERRAAEKVLGLPDGFFERPRDVEVDTATWPDVEVKAAGDSKTGEIIDAEFEDLPDKGT
jgi:hypothetical protein